MADLFRLEFEIGPDVPISELAQAIADVERISAAALDIAAWTAENDARREIAELLATGGFQTLVRRLRSEEVWDVDRFRVTWESLEDLAQRYDEVGGVLHRLWWMYPPSEFNEGSEFPWAQLLRELPRRPQAHVLGSLVNELVAIEVNERVPRRDYSVRSIRYHNPSVVELVAWSSVAPAALGYLLQVVSTLGPRRRRENARAHAEERIQEAHAEDVEDLVARRAQLREALVNGIVRGDITLTPEQITDALLDDILGAADRLADVELDVEQIELPDGSS